MSDLVERLRVPVKYHAETTAERLEAADEIERLQNSCDVYAEFIAKKNLWAEYSAWCAEPWEGNRK